MIHNVRLIACLTGKDANSTHYTYKVEDGTGSIDVKEWIDQNASPKSDLYRENLQEHTYVKIIGSVKSFQGKHSIITDSVRLISDPNEITHHFLEAIYMHELNVNPSKNPNNVHNGLGVNTGSSLGFNGQQRNAGVSLNNKENSNSGGGGKATNDVVREYIKVNGVDSDSGVHISDMIAALGKSNGLSESELRKAVTFMSDEGEIYSTVDDFHFNASF